METPDTSTLIKQCMVLLSECKTLQLATVDGAGMPCASYAPFLWHDGALYILVSGLAEHTASLLAGRTVSLMIIRDESQTRNLYARERVVMMARPVALASEASLLDLLEQRQGNTVKLLRTLPDFRLIQLNPLTTQYVAGFGKAYNIDLKNHTAEHRTQG